MADRIPAWFGEYMPRHRQCGRAIGMATQTIGEIKAKFVLGEYGDVCVLCGEAIEGLEDIEVTWVVKRMV